MAKEECIKTKNAITEKFITKCERPALDYGQEKMDTIWSLFHGDIINGGFHDLSHHDLTHTISFSTFSIDFSIFEVRKKNYIKLFYRFLLFDILHVVMSQNERKLSYIKLNHLNLEKWENFW